MRSFPYTYDARGLLCHVILVKDDTVGSQPDEVLTYAHDVEGLWRAVNASAPGEANRTSHITHPSSNGYSGSSGPPERIAPSRTT